MRVIIASLIVPLILCSCDSKPTKNNREEPRRGAHKRQVTLVSLKESLNIGDVSGTSQKNDLSGQAKTITSGEYPPWYFDRNKKGPDMELGPTFVWPHSGVNYTIEVRATLRIYTRSAFACYEKHLKANPHPEEELVVPLFLEVDRSGSAVSVNSEGGKVEETMFRRCIAERLKKKYPKPPTTSVHVISQLRFTPHLYYRPGCTIAFGGSCERWRRKWFGSRQ